MTIRGKSDFEEILNLGRTLIHILRKKCIVSMYMHMSELFVAAVNVHAGGWVLLELLQFDAHQSGREACSAWCRASYYMFSHPSRSGSSRPGQHLFTRPANDKQGWVGPWNHLLQLVGLYQLRLVCKERDSGLTARCESWESGSIGFASHGIPALAG